MAALEELVARGRVMTKAYTTQGKAEGNRLMEGFDQSSDKLTQAVQKLREREVGAARTSMDGIATAAGRNLWSNLLGGLLGFCLCAVIFSVLVRTLGNQLGSDPIGAMALTQAIAGGDLQVEIRTSLGDQTSLLASLRTMQSRLKSMINRIHFDAMRVAQHGASFAEANQQVAAHSRELAGNAQEQRVSAELMASAVTELSASVQAVAGNAQASHQQALKAAAKAEAGDQNAAASLQLSATVATTASTSDQLIRTAEGLVALVERFRT